MSFRIPKPENHRLIIRIIIILFFLGLNIYLGSRFIEEAGPRLSPTVSKILSILGLAPEKLNIKTIKTVQQYQLELNPEQIAQEINRIRIENKLEALEYNQNLASSAAMLLAEASEFNYDFDKYPLESRIEEVVKENGYKFQQFAQSTLVGPLTVEAVMSAWQTEDTPNEALLDDELKDLGLATVVIESDQYGLVGIVIQLVGVKSSASSQTPADILVTIKPPSISFINISDAEVLAALNSYRATHGHVPFTEEGHLCSYAEKRVGDLVAYGSLDDHQGFKSDFAGDQVPSQLQGYSGNQFGENLAYQHCRNMTTGESFVAQTGTALIEWCFDSSTKGHREAQLSTEFKNACIRHAEGMYVVIFGN